MDMDMQREEATLPRRRGPGLAPQIWKRETRPSVRRMHPILSHPNPALLQRGDMLRETPLRRMSTLSAMEGTLLQPSVQMNPVHAPWRPHALRGDRELNAGSIMSTRVPISHCISTPPHASSSLQRQTDGAYRANRADANDGGTRTVIAGPPSSSGQDRAKRPAQAMISSAEGILLDAFTASTVCLPASFPRLSYRLNHLRISHDSRLGSSHTLPDACKSMCLTSAKRTAACFRVAPSSRMRR
jgi:hypothetical protein